MLPALLERSYRRHGARYLPRALFLQMHLIYPVIALAIAGLSLYVGMSIGEYLRLTLVGCAMQLVYSLLSTRTERRLVRPITQWIEGSRSPEATMSAWRTA